MACGYEDGNDATRVRADPLHKLVADRDPERGLDLASQPTVSRFENGVTRREVFAMGVALAECVIEQHRARRNGKAKRITIDVDGTDDPTHGAQQGALFNGFYREHCYLPLLASIQFEQEMDQYLLTSLLRNGNASPALGTIPLLRRMLPRLREAFPKARLRVRLDGGFATPSVLDFLEGQGVEYVVAIASNPVLARLAEPLLERARTASSETGESELEFPRVCGPHDCFLIRSGAGKVDSQWRSGTAASTSRRSSASTVRAGKASGTWRRISM